MLLYQNVSAEMFPGLHRKSYYPKKAWRIWPWNEILTLIFNFHHFLQNNFISTLCTLAHRGYWPQSLTAKVHTTFSSRSSFKSWIFFFNTITSSSRIPEIKRKMHLDVSFLLKTVFYTWKCSKKVPTNAKMTVWMLIFKKNIQAGFLHWGNSHKKKRKIGLRQYSNWIQTSTSGTSGLNKHDRLENHHSQTSFLPGFEPRLLEPVMNMLVYTKWANVIDVYQVVNTDRRLQVLGVRWKRNSLQTQIGLLSYDGLPSRLTKNIIAVLNNRYTRMEK